MHAAGAREIECNGDCMQMRRGGSIGDTRDVSTSGRGTYTRRGTAVARLEFMCRDPARLFEPRGGYEIIDYAAQRAVNWGAAAG